jgi:hypothetical protein
MISNRIRSTTQKENLGIIVQYKVKVKIIVAMGGLVDLLFFLKSNLLLIIKGI